jgi:alcohol dehydrogenase
VKAIVISSGLQLKEVNLNRREGDSVVSIRRAGICGTDIAIAKGSYKVREPLILGHELFGILKEVPAQSNLKSGDRVVTEINVYCNSCFFCKNGMKTHCKNIETLGISRDGGFAEELSVPVRNLHKIPDTISDEEAPFIEPLAAAIQLTKMAMVKEGDSVLIIGSGRLGLLIEQVIRMKKPSLIAVMSRNVEKLEMAKKFGADRTFTPSDKNECLELVNGNGYDHVIEATGNEEGLSIAMDMVRPRGIIHVKSTHGLPANIDITKIVVKEVRIQGSRCGPFKEAIKLLADRKVEVKSLISAIYQLEDFKDAFEAAASGRAIKVQFRL